MFGPRSATPTHTARVPITSQRLQTLSFWTFWLPSLDKRVDNPGTLAQRSLTRSQTRHHRTNSGCLPEPQLIRCDRSLCDGHVKDLPIYASEGSSSSSVSRALFRSRGLAPFSRALFGLIGMYGPPPDCKRKLTTAIW